MRGHLPSSNTSNAKDGIRTNALSSASSSTCGVVMMILTLMRALAQVDEDHTSTLSLPVISFACVEGSCASTTRYCWEHNSTVGARNQIT